MPPNHGNVTADVTNGHCEGAVCDQSGSFLSHARVLPLCFSLHLYFAGLDPRDKVPGYKN